jgi:putative serine protease PepD
LIGNSSELEIGHLVLTIGYPFGTDSTMTSGLVGQKNYLLRFPTLGFSLPDTIVTDISVNPGNSSGHDRGEVVGIVYGRINPTAAPLGQFPGLTVGIPSYTHPAIGIIGSTLTIN